MECRDITFLRNETAVDTASITSSPALPQTRHSPFISTTQSPRQFLPFSRLPPELRTQIFKSALDVQSSDGILDLNTTDTLTWLALASTNREASHIALKHIPGTLEVSINDPSQCNTLVQALNGLRTVGAGALHPFTWLCKMGDMSTTISILDGMVDQADLIEGLIETIATVRKSGLLGFTTLEVDRELCNLDSLEHMVIALAPNSYNRVTNAVLSADVDWFGHTTKASAPEEVAKRQRAQEAYEEKDFNSLTSAGWQRVSQMRREAASEAARRAFLRSSLPAVYRSRLGDTFEFDDW